MAILDFGLPGLPGKHMVEDHIHFVLTIHTNYQQIRPSRILVLDKDRNSKWPYWRSYLIFDHLEK